MVYFYKPQCFCIKDIYFVKGFIKNFGKMTNFLFRDLALCNIVQDTCKVDDFPFLVPNWVYRHLVPEHGAVFFVISHLYPTILSIFYGVPHFPNSFLIMVVPLEKSTVPVRYLFCGISGDIFKGGVMVNNRIVFLPGIGDYDTVKSRIY